MLTSFHHQVAKIFWIQCIGNWNYSHSCLQGQWSNYLLLISGKLLRCMMICSRLQKVGHLCTRGHPSCNGFSRFFFSIQRQSILFSQGGKLTDMKGNKYEYHSTVTLSFQVFMNFFIVPRLPTVTARASSPPPSTPITRFTRRRSPSTSRTR